MPSANAHHVRFLEALSYVDVSLLVVANLVGADRGLLSFGSGTGSRWAANFP